MAKFKPASYRESTFKPASYHKPEPVADPLAGVEYTGDVEIDSAAEMSALKSGFIERANRENERREKATDSEYWCCLCFQSREQVEAFLRATGWGPAAAKYIDGQRVAASMGIDLPIEDALTDRVRISPDWADLSLPVRGKSNI